MNGSLRGFVLALLIVAPAGLLAAEVVQPGPEFSLPPGASWQTTLPRLAPLRDELFHHSFEVLSVDAETSVDDGQRALAATPVGHPVASHALQLAAEAHGVDALPAGVLMDTSGLVRGNLQGRAAADVGTLRQALVPLMSGGQAAISS
jgi:hypothetical protein